MNPGTENTSIDDITVDDVNTDVNQEQNSNNNNGLSDQSQQDSSNEAGDSASAGDESGGDSGEPSAGSSEDDDSGGTDSSDAANTNDASQSGDGDELTEEQAFKALSDETGVDVRTDEDIFTALTELNTLRASGPSTDQSDLSPAIQEAIKAEKAGVNLADHFARTGMDFDKMDGQEVLRQQFFKADAKLHNDNPKFAQRKFERSFNSKYGNWIKYQAISDETEKAEFAEEHGIANIEYERDELEHDTKMAKAELNDWKKEATPVVSDSQSGMTPEEADAYASEYATKVEKSWTDFEALAVEMGEGQNDFALGLTDTTRPVVEGWMNNPGEFLKAIGFDDGQIDTDRLLPIMTAIAELSEGTFGSKIAKFVVNTDNIETFKKMVDKPAKPIDQAAASQDRGVLDEWEQVGEAFEKKRQEEQQRR